MQMRDQIAIRGKEYKEDRDVILEAEEDSCSKGIVPSKKKPNFKPILKKITTDAMLERSIKEDCRQKEWKQLTTPPQTPLNKKIR